MSSRKSAKRVRKEEDDVIAKLDKMIEELEQQQQQQQAWQQQQQQQQQQGWNQPSQPMQPTIRSGLNCRGCRVGVDPNWRFCPVCGTQNR